MKKLLFIALLLSLPAFGQVTVSPFVSPGVQFLDNTGRPLNAGKVCTFAPNSTTPQAAYSDSLGTALLPNPIVLDSAGRATIFLTASTYKIVIAASTASSQCSPALQTVDGVTWATIGSTVTSLISTGNVSIQQSAAATSGANQSSPTDCIQGNYWTGAASAADKWCWQDILGTGSNPTSTLTSTHTGSSGTKTVSLPALTVTGASSLAGVTNTTESFVNTGLFTDTQLNQYVTSNVNALNFTTEFQIAEGSHGTTEGLSGGVNVPVGATVLQAEGLGGFATNSSTTTFAFGGYFQSRCLVNNTRCGGINPVVLDTAGNTAGQTMYISDGVAAPRNANTAYTIVQGYSASLAGPANGQTYGQAFDASSQSTSLWNFAFRSRDLAAATALQVGGLCSSGSCSSQPITFSSYNAGVQKSASWQTDLNGNMMLVPTATATITSGGLFTADGATATPSQAWSSDTTTGWSRAGAGYSRYSAAAADQLVAGPTGTILHVGKSYGFSAGDSFSGSEDTQISRVSAGKASFDTTAAGNGLGSFQATSPVINGTPTGTGISTATLKSGTGAGNYTSASTTYVRPDSTNLAYTVTIPTGWKLICHASGTALTITGIVQFGIALADGSADNTGLLVETQPIASNLTIGIPFALDWVVNGDGASHTINLQYKTTNGADSVLLANATSTFKPTMTFLLVPSN